MEFSAKELAVILKGTVDGDDKATARRFAKIENGKPGDLCFYANPKYEHYVYTTTASLLLVNKDFEPKEKVAPTMIRVENAYAALAELLKYVASHRNKGKIRRYRAWTATYYLSTKFGKKVYVGQHSHVGRHTVVGDCTRIMENVTVGDHCKIGKNCIFYPGVRIYPGMVIGDNVIIHSNAVIGAVPQPDGSWVKIEHLGNVVIGNDVEIGPGTTIGRSEMESTLIGNGVKIDSLCVIGHNVQIGDHTAIAGGTGIAGSAKIGKYCIIAGQVGISGHLSIADHTTIGPQAGIIGSITEEGRTVLGSPAIDARQYFRSYAVFRKGGK